MNVRFALMLAPLLGRQRTYAKLLRDLGSLRVTPKEHDKMCRMLVGRWMPNWENGSRRSTIADHLYLGALLDELQQSGDASRHINRARELSQILVGVLSDDANFRADGRMMHSLDTARRASDTQQELLATLRRLT